MGEPAGTMARADAILTFTAPRPAHLFGCLTEGPTLVVPIGSPETAIVSSLQLNVITAAGHRALDRPPTAGGEQREFWACAGARRVGGEGGIGGHGGHGGAARGRWVVDRGHSKIRARHRCRVSSRGDDRTARGNRSGNDFEALARVWAPGCSGPPQDRARGGAREFRAMRKPRRWCAPW